METTTDVLVIGAGPGGMAAAISAARAGASATIVEASDEIGGNAARSTGYLAFAGTDRQREAGIDDSADRFLADLRAEIDRQTDRYAIVFDDVLASLYAQRSVDAYRLLTALGYRFDRFVPRPRQHTVDRMLASVDVGDFRTRFVPALEELGVEVHVATRARRLTVGQGRVDGVLATREAGTTHRLHARRGVVLAAGGYQANVGLRRRYQPALLADTPYLGLDTDRGDGHLMGQALGGDLINMTMIPPLVMVASALVEQVIAVDDTGRRFHDEAGPYDDRVEALLSRPARRAHYVYDDDTADRTGHLVAQMPDPSVSAATLDELAVEIGCDADGLSASVAAWNDHVRKGHDPEHGRVVFPGAGHGIEQPPFHAVPMRVGINFPAGGLRVTTGMQVVDVFGEPVPGLFAVGDCVGGVSPAIGLGGIKIAAAITFGIVVGELLGEAAPLPEPHPLVPLSDVPVTPQRDQVVDLVDLREGRP